MSYEEFAKLRFLDFFPISDTYYDDDIGGAETGIGLSCVDGYAFTFFASPVDSCKQTAEIRLDFDHEYPVREAHALLDYLELPLRKGITYEQCAKALGNPEHQNPPAWFRYIVGATWPYYVGLFFEEQGGLSRVWICRKDLADEQIRLESTNAT